LFSEKYITRVKML